jgi:hypothetical protein
MISPEEQEACVMADNVTTERPYVVISEAIRKTGKTHREIGRKLGMSHISLAQHIHHGTFPIDKLRDFASELDVPYEKLKKLFRPVPPRFPTELRFPD